MCRAIKTLHNFKPPATEEEIRASSLQFVRKLSGFTRPSKTNEQAFNRAVEEVAKAAHELLDSLVTNAPPRDREVEAAKARARSAERFHGAV
jgi:SM-20-related protein